MLKKLALLALAGTLFAQTPPSPIVTLNWTAGPGNPAAIGYLPYRAPGTCGTAGQVFVALVTVPVSGTTYTDATVIRGNPYCYRVTAKTATAESLPSGTAEGAIPLSAPTGLTITVSVAVNVKVLDEKGVLIAETTVKGADVTATVAGQ